MPKLKIYCINEFRISPFDMHNKFRSMLEVTMNMNACNSGIFAIPRIKILEYILSECDISIYIGDGNNYKDEIFFITSLALQKGFEIELYKLKYVTPLDSTMEISLSFACISNEMKNDEVYIMSSELTSEDLMNIAKNYNERCLL